MSAHTLKTAAITSVQAFELRPDAEARANLASDLGIRGIRKLTFIGEIAPDGTADLKLSAKLGATVSQDCVVTAEPVMTRIDEQVLRHFLAEMDVPEADEFEMPEDDTAEPLTETLDLSAIMAEALALALPPWPRAEGIAPIDLTVTEPGKAPMTDDDAKPFAGLRSLKDHLEGKDG